MTMEQNRSRKNYVQRRDYPEDLYKKIYRFNKESVEWVATHFLGNDTETRGGALSNKNKMEIFLRSLGDPGFQLSVGSVVGCSQSTVSKIVSSVMSSIVAKKSCWIHFPSSRAQFDVAVEAWSVLKNLPDTIGAIDCTHVRIIKPPSALHPNEYVNRKGFFSINVQATCDAYEDFTSVDVSWPGSVHDSRIWKNSNIYPIMAKNPRSAILLGDEGYGITPWLLTPYKNPVTDDQKLFNKLHASDRVTIERCFGQLKRRFPMLHHEIRLKHDRIPTFIMCAFILHNVAKHLNDTDDFIDEDDNLEESEEVNVETEASTTRIRHQGEIRRNRIAEFCRRNNQNA